MTENFSKEELKEYVIEGSRISSLEKFYEEIIRVFDLTETFRRNLDAFDDFLCGWFGTPREGFIIRWVNSEISRENLGFHETVKVLKSRLQRCHPSNKPALLAQLEKAQQGTGHTIFDQIVDLIKDHGPGGQEDDNIHLILE